jgi:hypothetical protein
MPPVRTASPFVRITRMPMTALPGFWPRGATMNHQMTHPMKSVKKPMSKLTSQPSSARRGRP